MPAARPRLHTTAAEMVATARAVITEIAAKDALTLPDNPAYLLVDLRDIRERQREGFIPGSFHCPRGMVEFWVDPDSRYFKPIFAEDKTFLFYCASGWRSALAVKTLNDMGFNQSAHITEGFSGWKKVGGSISLPTIKHGKKP